METLKKYRRYYSPLLLIFANLVPLIGVFLWNWSVFTILLLYCSETFIIGIYNFFKIILAKKSHLGLNIFLSIFFLFHFNFFVLTQTVFVVVFAQADFSNENLTESEAFELVDKMENTLTDKYLLESLIALVVSHGFSFFYHYLVGGEYRKATANALMFDPYRRIVIQQLTVIFGGFALLWLASSVKVLLVLLVGLKVFFDLRAHFKQHQKYEKIAGINNIA